MKFRAYFSGLIMFLVVVSAFAADTHFTPAPATKVKLEGSSVTIRGTSSLHEWSMEGTTINGAIDLDPVLASNRSEESWKSSPRPAEVKVSIPVASVRSESERMDRLMRQALKAAKYPNITYQLSSSSFVKSAGDSFTVKTMGKLTIAGVTRDVPMDVVATRASSNRFILTGEAPIRMTDYGMKPPTAMLGTIKTGNDVKVIFRWVVEAARN